MIKARPCAGDIAAGKALLNELSPFIWRKYLDFAAVAEVHALKRQINAYRGHGEIAVEGHNIKLGRGGIREIEFFVQTQQLIAGGRNPDLRDRDTLDNARQARQRPLDRRRRRATTCAKPIASCARSSTVCRWSTTSRRRRFPTSARRSSASPAFWVMPPAMLLPRCCWRIWKRCSGIIRGCSRPRPAPIARRLLFRPTPTTARRSTVWANSASARRCRPPPWCATGSPAGTNRCGRRSRASISRSWCRWCSSSWRARTIRTQL